MTVKKNFAEYMLIELALCTGLIFGISAYTGTACEQFIGFMSILNLIMFIFMLNRIKHEILSIASLFVIFMYLFNLGIPIARLLNWVDDTGERFLARRIYSMGNDTFIQYMIYGYLLISMLQIGVLFYSGRIKKASEEYIVLSDTNYNTQLRRCKITGIVCILIGIIPYFYGEIAHLKDALVFGYQNANSTFNLSGTGIGLIGNLFIVGLMLELIYLQNNRKKFDFWFFVLSAYQILRMYITGDRSTGIALILVWILIRHKFVNPIKGKRAVLYLFLVYVGMLFIKLVEMTRTINSSSVDAVFAELTQTNMLAETVFEYGGNAWCGMMVYYSVPATGSFRCGLTYLAGIIGKPLSILGITNSVWNFADFSVFLREPTRGTLINSLTSAMGGSFSGEWYFNFGWLGILIIPFFGYGLAKFSDLCTSKKNNPVLSGFLLYVATLVIWWVRQYFTSVSWSTLVYGVVVWIIYSVVVKKTSK